MKIIENHKGWQNGLVDWVEGDTAFVSAVFSWQIQQAYGKVAWYRQMGMKVKVGGPAIKYNPLLFEEVAEVNGDIDALSHHNPNATFTSRGCIRKCPFCLVPDIEGDIKEIPDFVPRPIVCDNNLLACSRAHFDRVIDKLKPLEGIDFNQGLDVRLLTSYHASRLAELNLKCLRLSWDNVHYASPFMNGIDILVKHIPKNLVRVYVLIGFNDTPDDALYRLRTVRKMGLLQFPMRYQPKDTSKKNSYIHPNWTHKELVRFMDYWSHNYYMGIPFEEFGSRRSVLIPTTEAECLNSDSTAQQGTLV